MDQTREGNGMYMGENNRVGGFAASSAVTDGMCAMWESKLEFSEAHLFEVRYLKPLGSLSFDVDCHQFCNLAYSLAAQATCTYISFVA